MKKLKSTLGNMILSLGAITIVSGSLIGWVYSITKEPIAKMQQENKISAIRKVAPEFNNNPEADKWEYTSPTGIPCTVYPAKQDGRLTGAAIETGSMNGFAGEIRIMVGFDEAGAVKDYEVLKQGETPGLGTKMQTWFRDETANRSIIEKSPEINSFYVSKDKDNNGEIDAITAATISSRAFLESIRTAYEAYKKYEQTQPK